ncbi:MAG: TonB-dependent receptor [Acidobacteria bacterium]|nr:TonB-dependent receptor [Acidobacteriota bacterium]
MSLTSRYFPTVRSLCLAVLMLYWLNSVLHGQNSQGTIVGHITDPSGNAIVGARVIVSGKATASVSKLASNTAGDYVLVNVTPGYYDIAVEVDGFKRAEAHNLRVEVETTLRQDFRLAVGEVREIVSVPADAQMLQTDSATAGESVSSRLIEALPISGRDFTNLLRLHAGVTQAQGTSQLYWAQHGLNNDFTSVSVNGSRTESVSYLVDGVSANDQYFSTANNVPISGAIEEFKVLNSFYSAEYGQGSAQVNVAVKSGTNRFHGSAYDFLQNDAFAPQNPLSVYNRDVLGVPLAPKNTLKQNQYGFTLAGPVMVPGIYNGRGNTYFFYAYEAGRARKSLLDQGLVPTAAERTGDFSDWRDGQGNLVPLYDSLGGTPGDPSTRTPFQFQGPNTVDPQRFSEIASKFLNRIYPLPNVAVANMADCAQTNSDGSNRCFNYIASVSRPFDTDNNTFRVDTSPTEKDRLYLTAILGEQKLHNASLMPLSGEVKYQHNRLLALNWQRTIASNMVNQFRVGYNWMVWRNGSDAANRENYGADLGFGNVPGSPTLWGVPNVHLNGFKDIGNTNSGWSQRENNYQVIENLKWVRGKHTITLGADVRRYMLEMIAAFGSTGVVSFNGAYSGLDPSLTNSNQYNTDGAGSALLDFLLGNPISITGPAPGGSDLFDVRATNWNFFFQDDVRISPRLTMNLGLRYEIPPAYHDIHSSGKQLDMGNGGGFRWANRDIIQQIQQQPGYIPSLVQCCVDNKLVPPDHTNFAPRIGLAWRPLESNHLVLRAGYGIFYDLQNLWYALTTYDNISTYIGGPAFYPTSTGSTPAAPNPLDTLWLPSPLDYSYFGVGPNGRPYWNAAPSVIWPENRTPYNQQWTTGAQYALNQDLLLDVSYVGSHSLRQPGYWYYNAATMTAVNDPCNRYRTVDEAAGDPTCAGDPNFVPALERNRFPNISSRAFAVANRFSGNYNALQVRLNQRFHRGWLYQVNYTLSRTIDNVSAINNIPTGTLTLQNNNCFSCDYGPSSFDQPQRFVASGSYELPVGRNRKWSLGAADWVLGGWTFSGLYTVASGQPQSVFAGFSGFGQDGVRADLRRPNLVGNPNAPVYGALDPDVYPQANFRSDIFHWFNPAAFAAPAGNQYGNVGRNSIRQPYFMRGDIALSKSFPIRERLNFEYRLEIFNVFSLWHSGVNGGPNWGGGFQKSLASSTFGSLVPINRDSNGVPLPEALQGGVRYLWSPRVIQMALKLHF